jgi:hypothetical protein
MGLDLILLSIAVGIIAAMLILRIDAGLYALLLVGNILVAGLFSDTINSLVSESHWTLILSVKLISQLGLALLGLWFLRKTAFVGLLTTTPTAILIAVLFITVAISTVNSVEGAPELGSYFSSQLLVLKNWIILLVFTAASIDVLGFKK